MAEGRYPLVSYWSSTKVMSNRRGREKQPSALTVSPQPSGQTHLRGGFIRGGQFWKRKEIGGRSATCNL